MNDPDFDWVHHRELQLLREANRRFKKPGKIKQRGQKYAEAMRWAKREIKRRQDDSGQQS